MATKKTNNKSKSTKKSPSRLDKVIKKLNLARPRNQFIVAFLVVGVLGGGWMAYQSFAATIYASVNVNDGSLKCYAGDCKYVSEPQKNNKKVVALRKPANTNQGG